MSFRRVRTKVQKRQRAAREGVRDPVLGWHAKLAHKWAMGTLIKSHGTQCAICGEQMNRTNGDPREMTIDHILPISKGGTDKIDNLRLACAQCNHERGDRTVEV